MADINIGNLSDFDLDGSDLFEDSESYITELDDNGESVVGGYYTDYVGNISGNIVGDICGVTACAISGCANTVFIGFCGNTVGFCGDTLVAI